MAMFECTDRSIDSHMQSQTLKMRILAHIHQNTKNVPKIVELECCSNVDRPEQCALLPIGGKCDPLTTTTIIGKGVKDAKTASSHHEDQKRSFTQGAFFHVCV